MSSIFPGRPAFDSLVSLRAPKALVTRSAEIAKVEKQSQNEVRVRLLEGGVALYDWAAANWERVKTIRGTMPGTGDLEFPHLVIAILEAGLLELERVHRKRPASSAE